MFELAMPWALAALAIPLLIWFFIKRAPVQLPIALNVPFFDAVAGMADHPGQKIAPPLSITLLLFIWFLMVFALAGPRWVGPPRPLTRDGYNIMLALDISPSMAIPDMAIRGEPATRLDVVKRAATRFVQDRTSDKIGLILFGERAYLLTPLTYDRHSVLMRLEDATVGLAGKSTALGDALGLAVKRLQNVPAKGRMIILLTDGVNNAGVLSPLKAAELARTDGINVYTIGLGADANPQTFGGMFMSMNGTADLDEDTLKTIAKMTGGHYFRATDMTSLQHIYQSINRMARVSQEQVTVRPQHDYYPWPLAGAFILLLYLLAMRRGLTLPWRWRIIQ